MLIDYSTIEAWEATYSDLTRRAFKARGREHWNRLVDLVGFEVTPQPGVATDVYLIGDAGAWLTRRAIVDRLAAVAIDPTPAEIPRSGAPLEVGRAEDLVGRLTPAASVVTMDVLPCYADDELDGILSASEALATSAGKIWHLVTPAGHGGKPDPRINWHDAERWRELLDSLGFAHHLLAPKGGDWSLI